MFARRPLLFVPIAASVLILSGCPDVPGCPDCTIKTGKYTVPSERDLDGYTISEAKLKHDVSFQSHCPDPPSGDKPPCSRSKTKSVMPAEPGKSYEERLIFATDAAQDSESAEVILTLTQAGQPDVTERLAVTIVP